MPHLFQLQPRDVLFFRDARPMEASDPGRGAVWPRPDLLHAALHHAFLRQWPSIQTAWEGEPHTRGLSRDRNQDSSFRFGALRSFGPFPCRGGTVFFPTPLDWDMELRPCPGTDLPAPLKFALAARRKAKRSYPAWIPSGEYAAYLRGEDAGRDPDADGEGLFSADRNIGIAIDPATGTTVDGRFYQAEYLRLAKDVSMVFEAECLQKGKHLGVTDVFVRPDAPMQLVFGGQQGIADLSASPLPSLLGELAGAPEASSLYLRWTLLAPAVFAGGWRPGWVEGTSGNVMLKNLPPRRPDESRQAWKDRQKAAAPFAAKLVAACVGKPVPFSGWDLQAREPKPTRLAVPAGSSYIFECSAPDEAKALASALSSPNRRSDFFGDKGFGIGLCSFIQPPNEQTQG